MPSQNTRQFGKPSLWMQRENAEYGGQRSFRNRVVHPIIASEDSDESGGAPLWTPVSAEFSDTTTTLATTDYEILNDNSLQSNRGEPGSGCPPDQRERHQNMASLDVDEPQGGVSSAEPARPLVRHRHTLGSSLNALTAPFIPSIRHKKSHSESLAVNDQNQPMNENASHALVIHNSDLSQTVEHRLRIFANPSEETRKTRSDLLNWLTARGVPHERDLLDPNYLPFVESARHHEPADYAVVQIANIPYGISRAEIGNLVGRNSRRIADPLEGIHIIMTRVDGKTHDAFVEFENMTAAMNVVNRLETRPTSSGLNANTRLGDRHVVVTLSSQSALMEALFPNARGVRWNGSKPQFPLQSKEEPWKHFKGFMTLEELSMLVKHVEFPQRASFSTNCPERPYESYISVLKKFPWDETCYITIHMQHVMYDTAQKLLDFLQDRIGHGESTTCHRLTPQLLKRFVAACLLCPGFTVLQKDNIMVSANLDFSDLAGLPFHQPRFADCWRHQYAICPAPGVPQDVLEFYIGIIREETCSAVRDLPLDDQRQIAARAATTNDYWGYFWLEVGFPPAADNSHYGYEGGGRISAFDRLNLAEAARLEWAAIDRILRRALRPEPHRENAPPLLC
ncbi:uncharacterized protein B0I36DRAFT_388519 [Microdochium trichocladiopsis]|uniref:RRM domain-containing protein n=1 Tax=Microdochium trichocladiopsis TaxID=1682393 RepID=A0A9P8XUC2_9PEZI|nr:uncharacterized protein B0I36DRAFT_388519 [Microdochium trichocladiopsis]KAH7018279.1 hypothetical protein B0I36DRAFT_388519 [Microdochium trichocladiopsis]